MTEETPKQVKCEASEACPNVGVSDTDGWMYCEKHTKLAAMHPHFRCQIKLGDGKECKKYGPITGKDMNLCWPHWQMVMRELEKKNMVVVQPKTMPASVADRKPRKIVKPKPKKKKK